MPVGFENSAMKMSFSLSSLPPSSASLESPEHARLTVERPYNSLTKKPRRDPEQETWRRSWGSRDENKDEFWAALQSNYNYLMDNHLIDSCKEANGELSWDEQDVSQRPWTFNEFVSQFSELYSWLNNIQEAVYGKEENVTDRNLRLSHMEEIQRRSYRRKLFNDQAGQLMQRYPDMRDEVMWRVSHLNSKWEMLQQAMSPGKSKPEQRDVCTDVEHELRCLRKWIREMEARLQPLDFHVGSNWSPQELEEKAREHLVLQVDVESHGRIVCSVVKLCEKVVRSAPGVVGNYDAVHASRVACNLERRWHHLYLRALEWQCHLEALLNRLNNKSPAGVSVSDSDEEPVPKHPRLSGDISDQLTDDTGSYFEDDFEDLSVMDTSPSSALQTDDDAIMVGTTGDKPGRKLAMEVGTTGDKPGRKLAMESKASDVNDNYNTSANTVTPLREDGSRFDKSNRPAPNWGTFYFRHMDTDSEQDRFSKALAPQKLCPVVPIDSSDEDDAWTYTGGTDAPLVPSENIHKQPLLSGNSGYISTATELKTLSGDSKKRSRQNELGNTLFVNDTNNSTEKRGSIKESDIVSLKLGSKKESSSALIEEPEKSMTEGAPREGRKKMFAATHESKDCVDGDRSEESQQNCKVTIRELVNQAVKMTVRDFEPLVFTQTQAKQSRVKNWIKTNSHTFMRPQDSCDASGEYTTGDSDDDKVSDSSSEDQNGSVATCKHQIGRGLDSRSCSTEVFQDPDATPVNDKTLPMLATTPSPEHGKVIMRCRRRLATGEQRPWSVSGLSQLGLTGSDGALANFSISESALHQILASAAIPTASSPQGLLEEGSGSRTGSLRRRKVRTRRRNTGRKSESGGSVGGSGGSDTQNKSSNNLAASNRTLTKSGSFSGGSPPSASEPAAQTVSSTEEEEQMATPVVTPQFRLGAKVTPVNPLRVREGSVGMNEEQLSSFSEQAWDNYQEKYMSEPNSEELADSEAARRLLEIDDDYRNLLDSQSDCMSSSVSTNQPRTMSPVRRRRQGALPLVDVSVLDSDSDLEDIRHFIQQSQSQLMFSENVFAKQLTKTSVDLNDFAQIAATCRDNVKCLHVLLDTEVEGDLLSSQDCREIRGMLSRWETLQSSVEDSQRVQAFERDISALKAELLQLAARVNTLQEFQDRAQLEARILKIKKELSDLKERKPQLLQVNHAVHRFLTDASSHLGGGGGNSPPHPASVLKDDVAELYRVWDDAYNRISNHLVDLQRLSTTWQQLEVTMSELQVDLDHDHNTLRLIDTSLKSGPVSAEVTAQVRDIANVLSEKQEHAKQEGTLKSQTVLVPDLSRVSNPGLQFLSTEGGSLSDSGISDSGSENDLNGREKRLTALRQLARSMAAALEPGCAALLKINQELDQTESQLRSLQKSCRDLIVNTAVCMESNSLPLRNIATSTHNGISRRRKSSTPLLKATSPDADPDDPDDKRSGRWSWRLFRASLPFHVALVALFCVAWLLEPTCCDAMNNLVFSLTPQLRYVRGPPPT